MSHTTLSSHSHPSVASTALAAVAAWLRAWHRARDHRAATEALRRLNDRMLRDIGLDRADIASAVRESRR